MRRGHRRGVVGRVLQGSISRERRQRQGVRPRARVQDIDFRGARRWLRRPRQARGTTVPRLAARRDAGSYPGAVASRPTTRKEFRAPPRLSLTAFTGVERPTTSTLVPGDRGVSAETKTEERR